MSVDKQNAADQIEELRKLEEQILSQERRKIWLNPAELDENFEHIKARRSQEFSKDQKEAKLNLSVNRRQFLQWMGGASALMAAGCKRRPVDTLVPYVNKPQNFVAGVPVWYASSAANGYGLLVKTREGRPIKVEGNPDHPVNQGGLDAATQASVFDLYNPERVKASQKSGTAITNKVADSEIKAALKAARPGAVRILTGPIISPTLRSVLDDFSKTFKARLHAFKPLDRTPVEEAYLNVTKQALVPSYRFDKADVLVSFDSDFLGADSRSVENTKQFSKRRKIHHGDTNVNRLFVFESHFTTTGISADHRYSIAPSDQLAVMSGVLKLIAQKSGNLNIAKTYDAFTPEAVSNVTGIAGDDLKIVADALWASRGKSVVLAGGAGPDALACQQMAIVLNQLLQNYGNAIDIRSSAITGFEGAESYDLLLKDMADGKVDVLIVQGANPGYHQLDSEWSRAAEKVSTLVVISQEFNETTAVAKFVLGESHYLESWGDAQIRQGVISIQQPVIEPLFDTRSFGEILNSLLKESPAEYRLVVQQYWKQSVYSGGAGFESWWQEQLRKGATQTAVKTKSATIGNVVDYLPKPKALAKNDDIQVVLYQMSHVKDGSQLSNAWILELPDPLSKATWSNFLAISPELARKFGFREDLKMGMHENDVAQVKVGSKTIELPVHIQAGLRPNVAAIALGWGRSKAGSVGSNCGKNAYVFGLKNESGVYQFQGQSVEVSKTGKTYGLASTQRHFDLQGRDHDILQTATLADFLKNPEAAKEGAHHIKPQSMYNEKEFVYPGHRWGMAIDLNSCSGCNACVVACYSENNIGIVGEQQVAYGRHLAWLRLDVYYSGGTENPEATVEPMLCQQCANAPCETVCPVLATVHSSDGLNDMSYNRCVGTRYCANNCPYKVRRFNYFQYSDSLGGKLDVQDPMPMALNPDVTVRSRGVMEKCTFCVQRIRKTTDEFKHKKEKLYDGAIKTACQQSCPADAIVFGDLNDPESQVSKISKLEQGFKVLEVLNTRPSVTYLPRIRNKGQA